MKSFIKVTAIAALFLSMALGHAKEPNLVIKEGADSKSLQLRLESPALETSVRFHDQDGNTIYSEKTGAVDLYGKKFNLSELAWGLYYLEVEDSFKEITYTIKVSKDFAKIMEKEERLKPVFRKKGNKLFLNLLNLEKADVKIQVLDSESRVLFEEVVAGDMIVEKAISFDKAYNDKYTVVVKSGRDTYYEYLQVK